MLLSFRNSNGFTLIEVLIVMAIIGILATISVPQMSRYRMLSYNSAALSDLKNCRLSEESLYNQAKSYGLSGEGVLLVSSVTPGAGAVVRGPKTAATALVSGAYFAGQDTEGNGWSVGCGISNGVVLRADTFGVSNGLSYTATSKHNNSSRQFVAESESTEFLFCENQNFINSVVSLPAIGIATTLARDVLPGSACGGGVSWVAL